ncbi:hypothetical protein ACFL6U_05085 [Planctomycetota bacterium]
MKTLNTKSITTILLLAITVGSICKADELPLQLKGKTLTVYPIVLAKPDKPITKDARKFGERIAEVVGYQLEQYGLLPGMSTAYPETISEDDSLAKVEQNVLTFVKGESTGTDYALFAFFRVGPSKRGPAVSRICVVLADTAGQKIWSRDIADIPEGRMSSPLGACMMLAGKIRSTSDLEEPDPDNIPYGPMARLMDQRNGIPPKPERDAMEQRFEAAYESFSDTTLSIYPFRIWKTEDGSTEGAKALAEKLNEADLFKASAVSTDTHLVATRDPDQPSQMKILWDTARDFRSYLREHPASTDYALLVDITIPTHHVHIILCEGSGEWMTASLMNSHHPEFEEVNPKTLEDCVELAFRRLTTTVQEQKEQMELAKAVSSYKPDPRHTGRYTGKEDRALNYIELKPNGSFHIKDDGQEMKGTFAVVEGNRLVLTFAGRGSHPMGTFKNGKLITLDGEELTRTGEAQTK